MTIEPTADRASDELLAQRSQQGCRASLETLMGRFQVPLVHFLMHRTRCRADAEDLCQETLLRACEKLGSYQPTWRFSTWLFTIARRLAINHFHRTRTRAGSEPLSGVSSDAPEPCEALAAADESEMLWSMAAAVLNEEQFSAIWFRYVENLDIKEIARLLNRTQVSVKTILFRARRKLMPVFQQAFEQKEERTSLTDAKQTTRTELANVYGT